MPEDENAGDDSAEPEPEVAASEEESLEGETSEVASDDVASENDEETKGKD